MELLMLLVEFLEAHAEPSVQAHVQRIARLEDDFPALLMKLVGADPPGWQSFAFEQQLQLSRCSRHVRSDRRVEHRVPLIAER